MSQHSSIPLIHEIDMEYMINRDKWNPHLKNMEQKEANKKDLQFYRKRILSLSKDLLIDKEPEPISPDVKTAFHAFVKQSISYFKSLDKTELLQDDYKDLMMDGLLLNEVEALNKEEADKWMMRSVSLEKGGLDGFVHRKKTIVEKQMVLPINKVLNLKDPKFKTKGLTNQHKEVLDQKEKKKITTIYDEQNKQEIQKKPKQKGNIQKGNIQKGTKQKGTIQRGATTKNNENEKTTM